MIIRISAIAISVSITTVLLGCGNPAENKQAVDNAPDKTSALKEDSVPSESTDKAETEIVDWDPRSVPELEVPERDGDWNAFYKKFDFSLAVQDYRNDPAMATLLLREYLAKSSIQWNEMDGKKRVAHKYDITPAQKTWLKNSYDSLHPSGIAYCKWLQERAVNEKDVRTAVTATLLWLKLKQIQEPIAKENNATDKDNKTDQVERLQQIMTFFGEKSPARSIALLKAEINGELNAPPQWTVENLSTTWETSFSKSFGLSKITVSPPEGMTFLRIKADVTNSGAETADPTCLSLYQEPPREFQIQSATNWWESGVEMYPKSPPATIEPRRLFTLDMVHLVNPKSDQPAETKTFLPAGVIPCHVVNDTCDVLMGSQAGTMLMLMALSKKAVNPGLIASGSWVGQGTRFSLDVYFAVRKSTKFDYSLYLMGNAPIKVPEPK